jgi:ubiquinone/menaquinone biosynthesis C-methylase UbiE
MENEPTFFDFAAEVGLTKHFGGLEGTRELVALCHIDRNAEVLDVGCGAGQTACWLAQSTGCRVVGVDIRQAMVDRSRERAAREGITSRVAFQAADAQDLPFPDERFDATITESVTVFPEDKGRAVREYARVTRPGGYVGLNESTWLQVPPPPQVIAWTSQDLGAPVNPLTAEEWVALMQSAGLVEIVSRQRSLEVRDESRGLLRRYGCRGVMRIAWRALRLYLQNPAYRRFVQRMRQSEIIPENLTDYLGYGIYVGVKPGA